MLSSLAQLTSIKLSFCVPTGERGRGGGERERIKKKKKIEVGHQTIAAFRNRYAWTADSRIGNWSTDLLSHFFIILYHLIAHKIVYDQF